MTSTYGRVLGLLVAIGAAAAAPTLAETAQQPAPTPTPIAAPASPPAVAPSPPKGPFDFSHFSDQTWNLHLQLTRKAAARCAPASVVLPQAGGCTQYELDYLVREKGDPMLSQLHSYLPLFYRYDENRSDRPNHLLDKPFG